MLESHDKSPLVYIRFWLTLVLCRYWRHKTAVSIWVNVVPNSCPGTRLNPLLCLQLWCNWHSWARFWLVLVQMLKAFLVPSLTWKDQEQSLSKCWGYRSMHLFQGHASTEEDRWHYSPLKLNPFLLTLHTGELKKVLCFPEAQPFLSFPGMLKLALSLTMSASTWHNFTFDILNSVTSSVVAQDLWCHWHAQ